MALGIWLTAMLLLCPLTWNHEITLMLPVYLLPIIYVVTRRVPLPKLGASLFVLGVAGIVIPYYSTPMRKLHLYFFAVVIQYIATCMLIRRWSSGPTSASGLTSNPAATFLDAGLPRSQENAPHLSRSGR
jgi:hypothetical protein